MNTPLSHILSQKGTAVTAVSPSATVSEAVHVMNQFHIGAVLVTSAGTLLGIFTERDVLSRIVGLGADPKTTSVQAVMTTNLITVTRATTVDEAMTLFMERRIRHLPVLNDEGDIAGIISIGDINRCMLEENLQEARQLRHYIHGEVPCAV